MPHQDIARYKSNMPALDDFKPGFVFRDILPVLADGEALQFILQELLDWARPLRPQYVAAIDASGFILGGALATGLGCGFFPVRKRGKLPGTVVGSDYSGETDTDWYEIRTDLCPPGTRFLIHDDVLATGNGTRVVSDLIAGMGGEVVGVCTVIEKAFMGGRQQLARYPFKAVFQFNS